MSDTDSISFHEGSDPEMLAASQKARETFRYFWSQVALDFNRIVPAINIACLKVPFSEDVNGEIKVEQMWVEQIYFDGIAVTGILVNSPHWLTSVKGGDEVTFPISQISDWLCVMDGQVYGAYTIQVLRSGMDKEERRNHDEAWGLDFPEPDTILLPERNEKFEDVIANLIKEQIEEDPSTLSSDFGDGRTLLHLEALYGRIPSIQVLLKHGADRTACCNRGWTAQDYAQSLQWDSVVELLVTHA
jgi:uncharacterized protein